MSKLVQEGSGASHLTSGTQRWCAGKRARIALGATDPTRKPSSRVACVWRCCGVPSCWWMRTLSGCVSVWTGGGNRRGSIRPRRFVRNLGAGPCFQQDESGLAKWHSLHFQPGGVSVLGKRRRTAATCRVTGQEEVAPNRPALDLDRFEFCRRAPAIAGQEGWDRAEHSV